MKPFELSLEQQFNIREFSDMAKRLSREQAQAMLVECYRSMVIKETMYKGLLVQPFGVEKI